MLSRISSRTDINGVRDDSSPRLGYFFNFLGSDVDTRRSKRNDGTSL